MKNDTSTVRAASVRLVQAADCNTCLHETPRKAEHPLQGMELKEKEMQKK